MLATLFATLLPSHGSCMQLSRRVALRTLLPCGALPLQAACTLPAAAAGMAALYDEAATTYDEAYSGSVISRALDFEKLRDSLLSRAQGRVLELGVGTGLNLRHYPTGALTSLDAVDVSSGMMALARQRAGTMTLPVTFHTADAAALPFADNTFDTIVDTFSLCVFERPEAVLAEVRRVLRPDGKLLLLEHNDGPISRGMSLTRGSTQVASSCDYSQDVPRLVRAAGFRVQQAVPRAGGFLVELVGE